jgi:hypothetical protein
MWKCLSSVDAFVDSAVACFASRRRFTLLKLPTAKSKVSSARFFNCRLRLEYLLPMLLELLHLPFGKLKSNVLNFALSLCLRLSAACGVIPIVFAACFIWMPESPQYLLGRNKEEQAEKSLQWFRGNDYDIKEELDIMKSSVEESMRNQVRFLKFS